MRTGNNIKGKQVLIINILLRISVIMVMIAQFFNQNYFNVFLCIIALMMFTVPTIINHKLNINLPGTLEIIILLFIYSAVILGEIKEYYVNFEHWDTMLHTLNGFLMAAIGFSLVDIMNRSENIHINMSPVFVAFVAFCFSMTIGVLWEFFEFCMDMFFKMDMQKDTFLSSISSVSLNPEGENSSVIIGIKEVIINGTKGEHIVLQKYLDVGIFDTMKDLIVNFVGAVTFSIIGYFYIKSRGKGKFAKRFIPTMKSPDEIEADKFYRENIKKKTVQK